MQLDGIDKRRAECGIKGEVSGMKSGPRRSRDLLGPSEQVGGDVLSHRGSPAVPSAQRGLTSEFGMGSGDPPRHSHRPCKGSNRVRGVVGSSTPGVGGESNETGQARRVLSTARLHVSPHVHLPPINVVVSHDPSGRIHLGQGFPLRCVQRFSRPGIATRRCIWQHNRYTRGQSVPVLSY